MAINPQKSSTGYNSIQFNPQTGIVGTESVASLMFDNNGDCLFATGLTIPSNGDTGFAKGCIFIQTNVASGTGGVNLNKGTNTSCIFSLVTQA